MTFVEVVGAGAVCLTGMVAGVLGLRWRRRSADDVTQLIAMGEGMGLEYVPGERIDSYRERVVSERNERFRVQREAERDKRERERRSLAASRTL